MFNESSPQISVIIPVYNGEKYINRILTTISKQTFRSFEVLCVDDCSTDSSAKIIKKHQELDPRIIYRHTGKNLGSASLVVKRYIASMRGDYYFYASQDDFFSADLLEKLIEVAVNTGSEAVVPDMHFFHEGNPLGSRVLSGLCGDRSVFLSGPEAVKFSLNWTIPGCALWNMRLIKCVDYADFGAYSDEHMVRVFFLNANKVAFSEGIFFYSQDNPHAITKKFSHQLFDKPYAHYMLFRFLKDNDFDNSIAQEQLIISFNSLLACRFDILERKSELSESSLNKARGSLEKCFYALKNYSGFAAFRSQKGAKEKLKALLFAGNYQLFEIFTLNVYFLKKIRHLSLGIN